jgi:glycosyltransferase involved in cell wall biosynthesis
MTTANSDNPVALDRDDLAFVVIGGYEYSPGMNQPATATVRELTREHRVLNLISEAHGSVLRRVQGRAGHLGAREIARTVLDSTRPRRVEERLWLAPVRGLAAIGPLSVPEPIRRRNVRVFAAVIKRWLRDIEASQCVLVFYWWALPELVQRVPHVASIYDCVDDHTALPGGLVSSAVVSRLEGRLLDAVDRSFVVSPALLEDRAAPGRRISVLPNGFDLRFFLGLEHDGFAVPQALRSIPRPIVGYAGGLTPRIDWELMSELAGRRPEWSFLFIGWDPRMAPKELHRRPNVFFQSMIPYPAALGAMSCFDVGVIPVRVQQFSRGNSFLKLLDYFAHGIPVVATPVPDTSRVAEISPGLLELAEGADAWETSLARALEEPSASPQREARRMYVHERSVEQRVERMMRETLGNNPEPSDEPVGSSTPYEPV